MKEIIDSFIRIQNELLPRVELENKFEKENIQVVAGVDLAYWEAESKIYGVCCIVLIACDTKEIVEKAYSWGRIEVPYISGFLAFRELPLIIEAAGKLIKQPDLYMFDGNGYLHYRHMGIATHASFHLNKPTIGVAKSYLKIDDTAFEVPEHHPGSYTNIVIHDEVYGRALRTRENVKPIFVSSGNWIDLDTSTEIVMNLINEESRLPIPVRLADLETHVMRTKLSGEG